VLTIQRLSETVTRERQASAPSKMLGLFNTANFLEPSRLGPNRPTSLIYATADKAVAYMFYRWFFVFFCCFFPSTKNMRQPFSGTAERIFMKLYQTIPGKWSLQRRAAAWRMANVDDLRNLRYDWCNHQRAPRTAVAL